MKLSKILKIGIVFSSMILLFGCQDSLQYQKQDKKQDEVENNTHTLVVYFSQTGTTKKVAEYAADILQADMYEIIAANPYTKEDLAYYTNGRADKEQSDLSVRPKISGSINNIEKYDIILLGYPIWHGQAPRIISTFLESYDFSKKIIVPFCTSHSSDINTSATSLHTLTSATTSWFDGIRFDEKTSKEDVENFFNIIFSQ